ncbi:MAG: YigZ family protein [Bacteroidetes bacterium 4484_249]|nr:MAG: YigZ family protein [Bacteroidetes bacterium 4484_249]
MLFEDTYKTIADVAEGQFKDKGSKFIAIAFPVGSEKEIKEKLSELKKKYHDARHHCYAYRIGYDKSAFRYNDDGEPSGTAGRPIYGQILSNDLTNVLIVVVRYFGGTKLGVSGLINAYKTVTKNVLENSDVITKTINEIFEIKFGYNKMNNVMKIIKENDLRQFSHTFELTCCIKLGVRKKNADMIFEKFSKIKELKINYLHTE